jgi:resolvase-like protein
MRAAIYTRVSTQEQAESGTSLETQCERCRAYVDARGWMLVEEFEDAARTQIELMSCNTELPAAPALADAITDRGDDPRYRHLRVVAGSLRRSPAVHADETARSCIPAIEAPVRNLRSAVHRALSQGAGQSLVRVREQALGEPRDRLHGPGQRMRSSGRCGGRCSTSWPTRTRCWSTQSANGSTTLSGEPPRRRRRSALRSEFTSLSSGSRRRSASCSTRVLTLTVATMAAQWNGKLEAARAYLVECGRARGRSRTANAMPRACARQRSRSS